MNTTEQEVLSFLFEWGGIDGDHHKQWVIDQVVRKISKERYADYVKDYEKEHEGYYTEWDEGVAP